VAPGARLRNLGEKQDCMLVHADSILRCGASAVVEFGSWSRQERETDAPLDELVRRVRARGGPDAEALASQVLLGTSDRFERPTPDEMALFDRYVGPDDPWRPR
jgi:hypothetical protein